MAAARVGPVVPQAVAAHAAHALPVGTPAPKAGTAFATTNVRFRVGAPRAYMRFYGVGCTAGKTPVGPGVTFVPVVSPSDGAPKPLPLSICMQVSIST